MDFFRRLFPRIPLNVSAENREMTKKNTEENSLLMDTNTFENNNMLHFNGNYISSNNTSVLQELDNDSDPNKTLYTLDNVEPIDVASYMEIDLIDEVSKDCLSSNEFCNKTIHVADEVINNKPQSSKTSQFHNIPTGGNDLNRTSVNCVKSEEEKKSLQIDTNTFENNNMLHFNGNYISSNNSSVLQEQFDDDSDPNKTLYTLDNVEPIDVDSYMEIDLIDEVSKDCLTSNEFCNNTIHVADNDKPQSSKTNQFHNIPTGGNNPNRTSVNCVKSERQTYNDHISNDVSYNIKIDMAKTFTENEGNQSLHNINITHMKLESICADVGSEIENISNVIENISNVTETKDEIDDKTLQNLKEFEATLESFDKTDLNANNSEEIINLDEFSVIFEEFNEEKHLNYHSSFEKFLFEHNYRTQEDTNMIIPLQENIEVISINSSIEDNNIKAESIHYDDETQESDNDGYHSSDFEFISESEAQMDGFIINFSRESWQQNENQRLLNSESMSHVEKFKNENFNTGASDPGEGPSGLNKTKSPFEDRSYRNNHRVPEGDDYLGLFQGIYNPLMPQCQILFLENKSVRASAMNIQFDGIGFDKQLALRRHPPDSSEEEFEDEAKDCAQKILNMYPAENKRRRRRH